MPNGSKQTPELAFLPWCPGPHHLPSGLLSYLLSLHYTFLTCKKGPLTISDTTEILTGSDELENIKNLNRALEVEV